MKARIGDIIKGLFRCPKCLANCKEVCRVSRKTGYMWLCTKCKGQVQ